MSHFSGIYLSPGDFPIAGPWPLGIKTTEEATEPDLAEDVRVATFILALCLEKGSLAICQTYSFGL